MLNRFLFIVLVGITNSYFGQSLSELPCGYSALNQWQINGVCNAISTSGFVDNGGCTFGADGWGWFIGDGTFVTVFLDGTGGNPTLSIFNDGVSPDCSGSWAVGCINDSGDGGDEIFTFQTILGNYYLILVDETGSNTDISGCLSVSTVIPPPNDNCSGAITLIPDVVCNSTAGNSDGGTDSGVGCALNAEDDDVWYQFVATSTDHIVTVTGSVTFDAIAAVYTSCAATTSPTGGTCSSPAGNNVTLNLSCLTIGNTYFIKVHDAAVGGGDFSICVTNATTQPQDCEAAVQICSNDAFNYNSNGQGCIEELDAPLLLVGYTGACYSDALNPTTYGSPTWTSEYATQLANCEATYGSGNCILNGGTAFGAAFCGVGNSRFRYEFYINDPASNAGCLASGENQSSWYYATVETGGTFMFELDPVDPSNDYDFAVWGPYTSATAAANCSPIDSPLRCSWHGGSGITGLQTGQTDDSEPAFSGDGFVAPVNANAGDVYIILVDNFTAANSGYDFNWTGTATIGCTPVQLPVELVNFYGVNLENINQLSWETVSEFNNDHFVLERSEDGVEWKKIGEVEGKGTTNESHTYGFKDQQFRNVINYYRLIQVDTDGKTSTSNPISINNRLDSKELVKIINTLGQEVRPETKGLKFYLFSDGTIMKRFD